MSAFVSKVILDGLSPHIANSALRVDNDTVGYFRSIQARFPIGINRIDWSRIAKSKHQKIEDNQPIKGAIQSCLNELEANGKNTEENERIVWLADRADFALVMSINLLLRESELLFRFPQHYYVFPENMDWMVNLTFERDFYFARGIE